MKRNLGPAKLGWVWIVVLGEIAALGMELRPQAMAADPAPIDAKLNPAREARPVLRVSLQPILEFQPFGAVPVVPEPTPAEAPQNAPIVQKRGLALQGVLMPGSGPAHVLLSMDDAPAQSYGKGDVLPGGGTLFDIAADKIWIEIGGRQQALGFVAPPAAMPTQAAADGADTTDVEPAPEFDPEPADVPVGKTAVKVKSLPQPDLRHLVPDLTTAGQP